MWSGTCSNRFRLQLFKRRKVNLVLLYNLFTIIVSLEATGPVANRNYTGAILCAIMVCVFPIAGCLADICCSRYKLIKFSMWLIWVCAVVQSTLSTVFYAKGMCTENDESWFCTGVFLTVQAFFLIGLAGFLSNIIQFGMDQLQDASTTEITSFIVWYVWTSSFGILMGFLSQSCLCGTYKYIATLFFPLSVSIALCLDSLCNHWLVKEPVGQNPFKLFFGVLRYAAKNKYPRQRSAFTYWEDKPYSRIDLAKDKYGGPYNTEQVEDVKIVLRVIAVLAILSIGVGLFFTLYTVDLTAFHSLSGAVSVIHTVTGDAQHCSGAAMRTCFQTFMAQFSSYDVIFLFVPIHEFVVYPIVWKYVLQVKSVVKITFGLFLLVLHYMAMAVIEAIGYHYTDACFLTEKTALNFKWIFIPKIIQGLSLLHIFWGTIEFISSQAPRSMKGLLFGAAYFLLILGTLFASLLLMPAYLTAKKWHPVPYGCGVWFYLCVTLFFLMFTLLCICVFKKVYKMRRRDEDLHNRQIFAINYYSHYVQYNTENRPQ